MVANPTEDGRQTLFSMAERRDDDVTARISALTDIERSSCKWHRECYKSYTSEKNVRIREKHVESSSGSSEIQCSEVTPRLVRARNPDHKKCVFCRKDRIKGDRTLYRVSEEQMALMLLEYGRSRQDHVFTSLSTCACVGDIFAADVMYHPGCSKNYFRHPLPKSETPMSHVREASTKHRTICEDFLKDAFQLLLNEVDEELQFKSFELSALAKRLKELCPNHSESIDNRVVKRLLVNHYGEQLLFSLPKDKSKSSLVFKITIPLDEVVEQIRKVCTNRMEFVAGQHRNLITGSKFQF